LALRFNTQVRSRFLERYFHRPPPDEPPQHLLWRVAQIRREQGPGLKLPQHITNQHQPNLNRWKSE